MLHHGFWIEQPVNYLVDEVDVFTKSDWMQGCWRKKMQHNEKCDTIYLSGVIMFSQNKYTLHIYLKNNQIQMSM